MFCPKCNKIVGEENFCPDCGTPTVKEPQVEEEKKKITQEDTSAPAGVLVLGIVSVVSARFYGVGLLFAVLAIILYFQLSKKGGSTSSMAGVGLLLSIIGVIISLIVFFTLYQSCR